MDLKEVQSVRLTDGERVFLSVFLEEYYDGVFAKWIHDKIHQERIRVKSDRKMNIFQGFKEEVFMLGLGAIFFIFSIDQRTILGFIILFLFSVFLISSSLVSIFWKLKKRV